MKNRQIEESRYEDNSGVSLRVVAYGMLVFVMIGLLLNGSALEKKAKAMKYGKGRDMCVTVTRPLSVASSFVCFDVFRAWIESISNLEGSEL